MHLPSRWRSAVAASIGIATLSGPVIRIGHGPAAYKDTTMRQSITQLVLLLPLLVGVAMQDPPQPSQDENEQFQALSRRFDNLRQSLSALGGISDENREIVSSLRVQFTDYNAANPNHDRGIAHELQLAMWLREHDLVDSLFPMLIELADDGQPMRKSWIDYYLRVNNYERVITALYAAPTDPADDPQRVITLGKCYFAQHQFEDALNALDTIPEEATADNAGLAAQIEQLRQNCESYLELWPLEQVIRSTQDATGDLPHVELVTSGGSIVLELFELEAPNTVANFISLVEAGFYDGTKFHRVLANFMAQGGDPNTKPDGQGVPGQGGPGYRIHDEHTREGARNHFAGSLSMANSGTPHSGGSQFFLTHEPTPHLNGKHTVFGRILEGLDVARGLKINDVLESATVLRKRDHEYSPATLPQEDPTGATGLVIPARPPTVPPSPPPN